MVVLSTDVLPELRLTVDEYLQSDLPEGYRYELVDGVIQMSPTPDGSHDEAIDILQEALYIYRQGHPGAFIHLSQRSTVPIPGHNSAREPDLALYREWEAIGRKWKVWKEFTPFWVVEVISPDQEDRDYEEKPRDYWLTGVAEYWIIDRHVRRVVVMVRGAESWIETTYREGDIITSPSLPGFNIVAAELLGEPDQ